jgi:hypothetical protein
MPVLSEKLLKKEHLTVIFVVFQKVILVVFFGWPNLTLTPSKTFMGIKTTPKSSEMRVIDMYRREGDKLTENWVFIDLLHFWKILGVDILKSLK